MVAATVSVANTDNPTYSFFANYPSIMNKADFIGINSLLPPLPSITNPIANLCAPISQL